MNQHCNSHPHKPVSSFYVALIGLMIIAGLSACGGGGSGDPDPIPDEDPSGLYRMGTGTIGAINVTELNAFVHEGRILAFSMPARLLIDGMIDMVSGNDYTATVNVYVDGVLDQPDVAVSGTVTNGSSISGTLNGTGNGGGNFSITYDLLYERGASGERISTRTSTTNSPKSGEVAMVIEDVSTTNFDTPLDGVSYSLSTVKVPTVTCFHNGLISIPDDTVNVYKLEESISNTLVGCDSSLIASDYTGFAAVVDGVGIDDTVFYAVTNSTRSVSAILTD